MAATLRRTLGLLLGLAVAIAPLAAQAASGSGNGQAAAPEDGDDSPDAPDQPDAPDEPDAPDDSDGRAGGSGRGRGGDDAADDSPDAPDEPDAPDDSDGRAGGSGRGRGGDDAADDSPDAPDEPDAPDDSDGRAGGSGRGRRGGDGAADDSPDAPDEPDAPDAPDGLDELTPAQRAERDLRRARERAERDLARAVERGSREFLLAAGGPGAGLAAARAEALERLARASADAEERLARAHGEAAARLARAHAREAAAPLEAERAALAAQVLAGTAGPEAMARLAELDQAINALRQAGESEAAQARERSLHLELWARAQGNLLENMARQARDLLAAGDVPAAQAVLDELAVRLPGAEEPAVAAARVLLAGGQAASALELVQGLKSAGAVLAAVGARTQLQRQNGVLEPLLFLGADLAGTLPALDPQAPRVPLRLVSEALGAAVGWDPETRMVTVTREGMVAVIPLDGEVAMVNGSPVAMGGRAEVVAGATQVPAAFLAQVLGVSLHVDAAAGTVALLLP